jgi:hypothetical protein
VTKFAEVKADPAFRLSNADALDAAEQMLDLQPGSFKGYEFYSTNYNCEKCGKPIGIDDFVKSSVVDAGHDPSFVVHTLLGRKRIVATAKQVHCASCGMQTTH